MSAERASEARVFRLTRLNFKKTDSSGSNHNPYSSNSYSGFDLSTSIDASMGLRQQYMLSYDHPIAAPSIEQREKFGVVYTRSWVVDFILDQCGYTIDRPLYQYRIVEPAAGDGSFLVRIAKRLLDSSLKLGINPVEFRQSVVAYELDNESAIRAKTAVLAILVDNGVSVMDAELIADSWIRVGDYLLETAHLEGSADFVVGNPPYIRSEDLGPKGAIYRSCYSTMVGRADIYIAFFQAALTHLKPGGACGFICADRWMFNQYGAELRRLITSRFCVESVIQMHHADAFETEVDAYPAITILRNGKQGSVRVMSVGPSDSRTRIKVEQAVRVETWFDGLAPWPLLEPSKLALLRRLEKDFPTIEETGATVGIGVATGADKIYITKQTDIVESDRLLPLAMASDVKGPDLKWSGHFLVNPWDSEGLVELDKYPLLKTYLEEHRQRLTGRHVGNKVPANWFRTIDRVNAKLTTESKLYLPDFKGRIAPVLDRGKTYPHHNLYFIRPGTWDPEVLGGLLISDIAQFFIEAYGVRMRGGFLRFQAQYLRRLRLPMPNYISSECEQRLREAFEDHNIELANATVEKLYNLSLIEKAVLKK